MLARLRHPSAAPAYACLCDARSKPSRDPTGTFDLRRRYRTLLATRWHKLVARFKTVVVAQDIFGIAPTPTASSIAATLAPGGRVKSFQTIADGLLRDALLGRDDGEWLEPMTQQAYNRGVKRALRMVAPGLRVENRDVVEAGEVLQALVVVEIEGIMEAVSQRLVRIASYAVIDGGDPNAVMRDIADAINKIGVQRTNAMVEFMVVKAHATGTLDVFELAGIRAVGLVPETVPATTRTIGDAAARGPRARGRTGPGSRASRKSTPSASTIYRIRKAQEELEKMEEVDILTAGDADVCEECEGIAEEGPYPIDTARSLIPAHPYCRCAYVPTDDARFAEIETDETEWF